MDVDAQNYQRFLDGDNDGLSALVEAYKNTLTLYLCTFAPDVFTAEDWMEDTFVKLALFRTQQLQDVLVCRCAKHSARPSAPAKKDTHRTAGRRCKRAK